MGHARVCFAPDTAPFAIFALSKGPESQAGPATVAGTQEFRTLFAILVPHNWICRAVTHKDGQLIGMSGQIGCHELGAQGEPRRQGNDAADRWRLCQAGKERDGTALLLLQIAGHLSDLICAHSGRPCARTHLTKASHNDAITCNLLSIEPGAGAICLCINERLDGVGRLVEPCFIFVACNVFKRGDCIVAESEKEKKKLEVVGVSQCAHIAYRKRWTYCQTRTASIVNDCIITIVCEQALATCAPLYSTHLHSHV